MTLPILPWARYGAAMVKHGRRLLNGVPNNIANPSTKTTGIVESLYNSTVVPIFRSTAVRHQDYHSISRTCRSTARSGSGYPYHHTARNNSGRSRYPTSFKSAYRNKVTAASNGFRAPLNRNIQNVGLGSARNFSTAQPVYQNIIAHNAPLAIRALFCQLDDDNLKHSRNHEKEQYLMAYSSKTNAEFTSLIKHDDLSFLGSPNSLSSSILDNISSVPSEFDMNEQDKEEDPESCFEDEGQTQGANTVNNNNIILRIPLVPSRLPPLDNYQQRNILEEETMDENSNSSEWPRLLTPDLVQTIANTQYLLQVHQLKIRGVLDSLERAGCFSSGGVNTKIFIPGKKYVDNPGPISFWYSTDKLTLHIGFAGCWAFDDVLRLLNIDNPNDHTWFEIIQVRPEQSQEQSSQQGDTSLPLIVHDLVASRFILPDPCQEGSFVSEPPCEPVYHSIPLTGDNLENLQRFISQGA